VTQILSDMLGLAGILLAMFVLGIGWWAFGRWLRQRGHGEQLDQLGERTDRARRGISRALGPVGSLLVGVGAALSRVPLFSSKRQRAAWDDLQQQAARSHRDKNSG